MMDSELQKIFSYIDNNTLFYIERLRSAVMISSVSADLKHRSQVFEMIHWTKALFENLDVYCKLVEPGSYKFYGDAAETVPIPPVLFGSIGNNPDKYTLLIYGHLDVQPAALEDGWYTEPFQLTKVDDKLYGRGSSDDKGPVMGWINCIEAFKVLGIDLPVNFKFIFEAMEESGSIGLETSLKAMESFLKDVDFICISDTNWLGKTKPCLGYGLRGVSYYFIEIECASKDLHSGGFGGVVPEAMVDLVNLMSQLVGRDGKILIPGIYEQVAPITEQEISGYKNIDFDIKSFSNDVKVYGLNCEEKAEAIMRLWRQPSLSLHGIHGAFYGNGCKTVIPRKVTGKFSIRTVPNIDLIKLDQLVVNYVTELHSKSLSPNKCNVMPIHSGSYWLGDIDHPHFKAAANAVKRVWNVEPDFIREGSSVPATLIFQEMCKKSILIMPMGASDDAVHAQNEKLNITNYIQVTKQMAAYLFELSQITK